MIDKERVAQLRRALKHASTPAEADRIRAELKRLLAPRAPSAAFTPVVLVEGAEQPRWLAGPRGLGGE